MNRALDLLQPYPFEKLRALLAGAQPPADKKPIALSIGEPKHRSPDFVARALTDTGANVTAAAQKAFQQAIEYNKEYRMQ